MIRYDPLWKTMEERGITKYKLGRHYGFGEGTIQRLREGKAISLATLDDLCKILKCRVEDILLFVDEGEE